VPAPVLSAQSWLDLTFLHWAIDPTAVASLLPTGTHPDVIDGHTFVALVPFRMSRLGLGEQLALPWLGDFSALLRR